MLATLLHIRDNKPSSGQKGVKGRMSLVVANGEMVRGEELITVKQAARMLSLAEKTVHKRGAGTEQLRRVRLGRAVRLVRSEVERLRAERLRHAELPT